MTLVAAELLHVSDPERRERLAEGARWFFSTTVGSADAEDGRESRWSAKRSSISMPAVNELLGYAADLYDDALSTGDADQAHDAVVLAAGLVALAADSARRDEDGQLDPLEPVAEEAA